MLQLDNKTPFVPSMFVFPDASGIDTAYVVLKATFSFGSKGVRVAEKQRPIVPADKYWGEPGMSSIRYEGEGHLPKPATDIVLVGSGHAPGGRPAPYFGASFSVGRVKKVVHVFGERVWRRGLTGLSPSAPLPAASVPLLWERAYGGQEDVGGGTIRCEQRNPVGRGFLGKRSERELENKPVANLENPSQPIKSPGDKPPPAGVGFIAPSWQPRVAFAGTYDAAWQKGRAPYLPANFDARFLQAAPADQIYPGFLQGSEPIELVNVSPAGPQRFVLPVCELHVEVHIAGEVVRPPLRIETLLLEPDDSQLSILWRGAVPCDKRALKISKAVFQVKRLLGAAS